MVARTIDILADLPKRIAETTQRGAQALGAHFREGADRIRAAVDAFYRSDGQFATSRLRDDYFRADGINLLGWDDSGNAWSFTPEHVRSAPLRSRDGTTIGVVYPSTIFQAGSSRLFSAARRRRGDLEYLVSDDAPSAGLSKIFDSGRKGFGRTGTSLQHTPWSRAEPASPYFSPTARSNPIYVDAHASPSEFIVRIKTGRLSSTSVTMRGDDFARLTAANTHFNRALSENPDSSSLVLLACQPAFYQDMNSPNNASMAFADSINKEAGLDKHVFGAVGFVRLLGSDLNVELPGGHYSESPAWIQHTAEGRSIPIWPNIPEAARSRTDDDAR